MIFCLLQWTIVLLQSSNEEVKQKLKDDQQAKNANKEAAMQRIVAIARKLDDDNDDGVAMAPKLGANKMPKIAGFHRHHHHTHQMNGAHKQNKGPNRAKKEKYKSMAARELGQNVRNDQQKGHNKQKAKKISNRKKKEKKKKLKEKAKEIAENALLKALDKVKLGKSEEKEKLKRALKKEMEREEEKENKEKEREEKKQTDKERKKEMGKEEKEKAERKREQKINSTNEKTNSRKGGTNQRGKRTE
ncbi:hypothetical protein niasHT_020802 [Heterodera trifolii]|uniref:Uncharacterized protein n=1 Tax=Heterodera trifolii TaxID=157864 RepID=A0ABD2KFK0_9BILA